VVFFRRLAYKKIVKNREPEPLELMYSKVSDQVGFDAFRDVLMVLEESYSIDKRLIRPGDSLDEILSYDSWSLGGGTERLDRWLISNKVNSRANQARTILDLARIVEDARSLGAKSAD